MNDELMCLFFRLEYAVQTMRRRQKTAKKHGKEWQLLLADEEAMVDDLLLRLEAARERPPQEAGSCV